MQGAKPWNTLCIVYSKVKQRSRRCFLVELNSAGDFSDTPQAKSQKDRQHIPKGVALPAFLLFSLLQRICSQQNGALQISILQRASSTVAG